MALRDAISKVQEYLRAVEGIREAPAQPPDAMNIFPFAVCYPGSGNWEAGSPAGMKTGLHNIVIEIHVARKDLPHDYDRVVDFCEAVPNALMKELEADHWDGVISTFRAIRYEFTTLGWQGIVTIGYRFTIESVKIQSPIA